jgi:hypothetical protein
MNTLNRVPKWNGASYSDTGSPIFEDDNNNVGIGTNDPQGSVQIYNSVVVAHAPDNDVDNDWDYINDAILAVNGSGTVYLQAGTYLIDQTITLAGAIKLIGAGRLNGTRILMQNTSAATVIDTKGTFGTTIKDLQIDAFWDGDEFNYDLIHLGIDNRGYWLTVENIEIDHMDIGVWVADGQNYYKNVEIDFSNIGIRLGDYGNQTFCDANLFMGCYFKGNQIYAIHGAFDAYNNKFIGITLEGNFGQQFLGAICFDGAGIYNDHKNNIVDGCYFEANDVCQFLINSKGNFIHGNFITVSGSPITNQPTKLQPSNPTLVSGGTISGSKTRYYVIEIEPSGNTFRWSDNSRWEYDGRFQAIGDGFDPAKTWYETGHQLDTGNPISLSNGISITFPTVVPPQHYSAGMQCDNGMI